MYHHYSLEHLPVPNKHVSKWVFSASQSYLTLIPMRYSQLCKYYFFSEKGENRLREIKGFDLKPCSLFSRKITVKFWAFWLLIQCAYCLLYSTAFLISASSTNHLFELSLRNICYFNTDQQVTNTVRHPQWEEIYCNLAVIEYTDSADKRVCMCVSLCYV